MVGKFYGCDLDIFILVKVQEVMKENGIEQFQDLTKLIGKLFRFENTSYGKSTEQVFIVTDARINSWGESVIFYQRISTGSNFRVPLAVVEADKRVEWLTP